MSEERLYHHTQFYAFIDNRWRPTVTEIRTHPTSNPFFMWSTEATFANHDAPRFKVKFLSPCSDCDVPRIIANTPTHCPYTTPLNIPKLTLVQTKQIAKKPTFKERLRRLWPF